MKFATHSPAPWRARARRVVDANGAEICVVHQTVSRPYLYDCTELARFISMAPELLAALQSLTLFCRYDVLNPCWDDRPTDIPGRHWAGGTACPDCTARAFIAKATQQ